MEFLSFALDQYISEGVDELDDEKLPDMFLNVTGNLVNYDMGFLINVLSPLDSVWDQLMSRIGQRPVQQGQSFLAIWY